MSEKRIKFCNDKMPDNVAQSKAQALDRMKKTKIVDLDLPKEAQDSMRRRKMSSVYDLYRYDEDFGFYGLVHDWKIVSEIEKCLKAHGFLYPLPYKLPYPDI